MGVPESVIVAALAILQAFGVTHPPAIEVVAPGRFPEHQETLARLRGFRRVVNGVPEPVIYIVNTTQTYRGAAAGDLASTALIASTILHEITHGRMNGDEHRALTDEIAFLTHFVQKRLIHLSTFQRRLLLRHIDLLNTELRNTSNDPGQAASAGKVRGFDAHMLVSSNTVRANAVRPVDQLSDTPGRERRETTR